MKVTLSTILVLLAGALGAQQPLSLDEALQMALGGHPRIREAEQLVEAAHARRRQLLAEFAPALALHAVGSEGRGDTGLMSMLEPSRMFMLPPDAFIAASLTFQWRVFTSGRDAAAREAAAFEVHQAELELARARIEVIHAVRTAFAEAAYRAEAVAAHEAGLVAAEEMEALAKARFEEGKIPEAFLFAAEAQTERARRDLRLAQADLEASVAQLEAAVGSELPQGVRPGAWRAQQLPEALETALQEAYTSRTEMLLEQARAGKHNAEAEMARRSALPELSLFGTYLAFEGDRLGSSTDSKIGLLLSMPLADGGLRRARAGEASAGGEAAESRLAAVRLDVAAQVRAAWARRQAVPDVLRHAEAELRAAEEAYRIARLRFDVGRAVHAEVQVVLADLIAARVAVADAHRFDRLAEADMLKAVGRQPETPNLNSSGG
jgi:cobalt-zinc-cadmium efflux system outer membrane protein